MEFLVEKYDLRSLPIAVKFMFFFAVSFVQKSCKIISTLVQILNFLKLTRICQCYITNQHKENQGKLISTLRYNRNFTYDQHCIKR